MKNIIYLLITIILFLTTDALFADNSTADHTTFDQLQGPFNDGPEITKACLSCHTEAAKQMQVTRHWTWSFNNPLTGQILGKAQVINNYCIAAVPNIQSCALCHIGYDWTKPDTTFENYNFKREENVDCLVCHDTTGTYTRSVFFMPGKRKPDLANIAQQVGQTSRRTCGSCHFAGGGDKGVKHGDIDPTLENPDVFVDVHMSPQGAGFTCSTCHAGSAHDIRGSHYAPTGAVAAKALLFGQNKGKRTACTDCHGQQSHQISLLNHHTDKIACETCHIPTFARGNYGTKTWWDWSAAGRLDKEGKPIEEKDALTQEIIYSSKKGNFLWGRNVVPEYRWFNGVIHYTLIDKVLDPNNIVSINSIDTHPEDPQARIAPFKIMRGRQPYDLETRTLVAPLTTTDQGYWHTFDWEKSIQLGMTALNRQFSGKYGFIDTEMYWQINHMVAPRADSLSCNECHSSNNRLANVPGIYLLGYSRFNLIEILGQIMLGLALFGTLGHGLARIIAYYRRNQRDSYEPNASPIILFSNFERFWHWLQTLLLLGMLLTGFEVHGSLSILGFANATNIHRVLAWLLLGLWGLAAFWHVITNEWRQYLPSGSTKEVVHYYLVGIFKGVSHPFRISPENKHNPLQRIAYLIILTVIMPLLWITGLIYLFHADLEHYLGRLPAVLANTAMIHTLLSYFLITFIIIHLYIITATKPWHIKIKAMLTGRY